MKPIYIKDYTDIDFESVYETTPWERKEYRPREESFMALIPLQYTYGIKYPRTYNSTLMTPIVRDLMNKLNKDFNCQYDICFLNLYKDETDHLGWHSDDSPTMDMNHPICSISLGAQREIWVKKKSHTGIIPSENRYLLEDGSLFIMPSLYQKGHLHKIPKGGQAKNARISLTYRKYK